MAEFHSQDDNLISPLAIYFSVLTTYTCPTLYQYCVEKFDADHYTPGLKGHAKKGYILHLLLLKPADNKIISLNYFFIFLFDV